MFFYLKIYKLKVRKNKIKQFLLLFYKLKYLYYIYITYRKEKKKIEKKSYYSLDHT